MGKNRSNDRSTKPGPFPFLAQWRLKGDVRGDPPLSPCISKIGSLTSRIVLPSTADCARVRLRIITGNLMAIGQRKEEGMEKPIVVFTLSTCSHCKATKRFLDDCAVKYEFTDVDLLDGEERTAILEDVRKWNPRCSFPTIIIGDKVIVGYREDEIKEALGL
jgi:glutaredoxin-like protein NrdH